MSAKLKLVRDLGTQGAFRLWLAHDSDGKPCWFERLGEGVVTHPSGVKAFIEDCRRLRTIHHVNILHLRAVDKDEQGLSLTWDHVRAVPLSALLKRLAEKGWTLSMEEALHLVHQILFGLKAVVDGLGSQMFHGRLTPDALLVGQDGYVRIRHFRLHHLDLPREAEDSNWAGSCVAPEMGKERFYDSRVDMFSLGALFLSCFGGTEEHVSHRSLPAETPEPWRSILYACLSRNPVDRPLHPGEMLRQLGGELASGYRDKERAMLAARIEQLYTSKANESVEPESEQVTGQQSGQQSAPHGTVQDWSEDALGTDRETEMDLVPEAPAGDADLDPSAFWGGIQDLENDEAALARQMREALVRQVTPDNSQADSVLPAGHDPWAELDQEATAENFSSPPGVSSDQVHTQPAQKQPGPQTHHDQPEVFKPQPPAAKSFPAESPTASSRPVVYRRSSRSGNFRWWMLVLLVGILAGLSGWIFWPAEPVSGTDVQKEEAGKEQRGEQQEEPGEEPGEDAAEEAGEDGDEQVAGDDRVPNAPPPGFAPVASTGEGVTLEVASKPGGAFVFVDGEQFGMTPAIVRKLKPDVEVELQLIMVGHLPWKDSLNLGRAGEKIQVQVDLRSSVCKTGTGLLYVSSEPVGARMKLDGLRLPGKTPSVVNGVCGGLHEVELHLGGYRPAKHAVEVMPGKVENINSQLEKI
ncbi:MAG: PEGA domain-containing protein [Deltaproteobacteria bacterium]|nr:PEGA domain-containing protein [Deltaproteobacteria bacterium]